MPGAQIVAVIAARRIAGIGAEILEVGSGAAGMEFMIADRRTRARFLTSPGGVITFGELLGSAAGICVIAHGEHRAGNRLEESGRRFGAGKVRAIGNIARTHQDRISVRYRLRRRRRLLRVWRNHGGA